jgi:hypothetical protein
LIAVSTQRATLTQPGAEVPEYIFEGPFSMKLTPTDDDPGNAALSVADATGTGRLVNGTFSLPAPLQVKASSPLGTGGALGPLGTVLTYSTPASHDPVTVAFRQTIGANDALRTGSYAKTLTFTLSTTSP